MKDDGGIDMGFSMVFHHFHSLFQESADEMLSHFSSFEPLNSGMEHFQIALQARGSAYKCARDPRGEASPHCQEVAKTPLDVFGGVPKQIPLVDVVIVRCLEDLNWVVDWLKRILRDEWTPEVMGVLVRLVIYEKCQAA